MNSSVASALADAHEHYRHGRFSDAEAGYRRVLEHAPDQPDALYRLAILARQAGRSEAALTMIERAIAANDREAAYYNEAGIALYGLGRIDEAVARFRTALSLRPDFAAAQNNFANILREQGRFEEAVAIYRKAVALRRDSPDLWYNLGNTLADLRAFDDAVRAYRNAVALRADFAPAHARLGDAMLALHRPDEAVAHFACALASRETPDAIAGFVVALAAADLRAADANVHAIAVRALSAPWSRPSDLASACVRLLAADASIGACVERATSGREQIDAEALFGTDRTNVFGNPLLRALLESAPVCDPRFERFLTLARHALLAALAAGDVGEDLQALAFCCALAQQCFVNDYVFSSTAAEIERVRTLRAEAADSLAHGGDVAPMHLAVVAAYRPLHALPHAKALLARPWPEPVATLVARQVAEPLAEQRLRSQIPRLTSIEDAVSLDVRAQYEEHPYPRWVKLPRADVAGNGKAGDRALWRWHDSDAPIDILVAGCGTGQESIEFAQAFPQARVLAVDLSLASLAYAERKARESGIANVEHAQADLTRLAALGRRFQLISSVGVLHHLADPVQGLRALAAMLVPDGHMLVGLYSELGRDDVVAARAFIAERGYRAVDDDIRRCRQDLALQAPGLASRLARRNDFYVTGECRDLLFHVQEHRFTLSQIGDVLDGLGLRFDGFLLRHDLAARYASQFPADRAMTDLANWQRFEAQVPDAFAGMYLFWIRQTG